MPEIDFENTTCVFAHPKIDNLFFCEDNPQGMTQDIRHATKYMGEKSRTRGLEIVKERFPNIKDGMMIFYYFKKL